MANSDLLGLIAWADNNAYCIGCEIELSPEHRLLCDACVRDHIPDSDAYHLSP